MSVAPAQIVPPAPQTRRKLRLRLKPSESTSGYVDGAWWPRSHDLTTEMPELAAVLAERLRSVWQVVYPLESWDAAPRRIQLDGHAVRLEGFRSQDENVINVVALDRRRVRLLVIPPNADKKAGDNAMTTAADRDNVDSPTTILTAAGIRPDVPAAREADDKSKDRWEADGGPA